MIWRIWISVLTALLPNILPGCTIHFNKPLLPDSETDCSVITIAPLSALIDEDLGYGKVSTWIEQHYAVPRHLVESWRRASIEGSVPRRVFLWDIDANLYWIETTEERVSAVQLEWNKPSATLGNALECLGAPEAYLAWYGWNRTSRTIALSVLLFYPQRGTVVLNEASWQLANRPSQVPPTITEATTKLVRISQEKSIETLLEDYLVTVEYYQGGPNDEIRNWYLGQLKQWPGAPQQMEYITGSPPDV